MSGLISGLALRLPITGEFTSETKFVALVYADHAWEDGSHAYPAVSTVAAMTGYSERTVQRHLRILENLGILVITGKGPRGTNSYSFPIATGDDGSVRLNPVPAGGGVTVSPRQADGGDRDSGDTDSGDTPVTRINNPSLKIKEEEGAGKKLELSQDLQGRLQQAGVYTLIWPEIATRLDAGWVEQDIVAILDWMRQTCGNPGTAAQRFVARVREGTKAPQKYYPVEKEPAEDQEGAEDQPAAEENLPANWWQSAWEQAKEQMRLDMPKSTFDRYLQEAQAIEFSGGIFSVRVASIDAMEWLSSRATKSATRLLAGICNQPDVDVAWIFQDVSVETEPVCQP